MSTAAVLSPNLQSLGLGQLLMLQNDQHSLVTELPVMESLLVAWPQIIGLIALTVICFGIAYYVFMREEIRA
jgi:ABC-2 type transport system permease protein